MTLSHGFAGLVLAAAVLAGAPALAQSTAAKPSCAAGDTVVWENSRPKSIMSPATSTTENEHGAYACKSAADAAGYHASGRKSSSMHSAKATPRWMGSSKMGTPAPAGAMGDSSMKNDSMGASPAPGAMASSKHHHHKHGSAMASPARFRRRPNSGRASQAQINGRALQRARDFFMLRRHVDATPARSSSGPSPRRSAPYHIR